MIQRTDLPQSPETKDYLDQNVNSAKAKKSCSILQEKNHSTSGQDVVIKNRFSLLPETTINSEKKFIWKNSSQNIEHQATWVIPERRKISEVSLKLPQVNARETFQAVAQGTETQEEPVVSLSWENGADHSERPTWLSLQRRLRYSAEY